MMQLIGVGMTLTLQFRSGVIPQTPGDSMICQGMYGILLLIPGSDRMQKPWLARSIVRILSLTLEFDGWFEEVVGEQMRLT